MTNPQALREAIDIVLRCNDDAPGYGMCDQKDNDGQWYQSASLANALLVVRQFLSPTTVATAVTQGDARGIIEAGQFLLDRISDLSWTDDGYDDLVRDWMGHVDPALDRFRAALAKASEIIAALPQAGEVEEKLGKGEFFVDGDKFDLIFRPGGGNYGGADKIVARMACGDTAYWLPSLVARFLNGQFATPPSVIPAAAVGDFRCHNCKRIVEGVRAAPKKCPDCQCSSFSAVAYSERPTPAEGLTERYRAALRDIADAENIPTDAEAFLWCKSVAQAALTPEKDA